MGKTSFDDFLSVVESGQTKTASLTSSADGNILAKLAEELEGKSGSAPTAEGQVTPADSGIAQAAPAVVGATQAVESPQLALAGGNAEEAAAGEVPAPTKPNQGLLISANDGAVTTADQYGKTPAAVAAAARDGGGAAGGSEKTAEQVQAESIGEMIADAFLDNLVKQAEQGQYQEAVVILKEAGLLDAYNIVDDAMDKTASQEEDDFTALTKIANNVSLTHEDMIKAASEYLFLLENDEDLSKEASDEDLEKEASDVEAQARLDARQFALDLQKEALDAEAETFHQETEKVAMDTLMQDQAVVDAVAVLKNRGLI